MLELMYYIVTYPRRPLGILLLAVYCHEVSTSNESFVEVFPTAAAGVNESSVPLYFGLMLSLSGDQQSTGALAGVQAALDEVNSRDDLLPGYSLHYILTDSQVRCVRTCLVHH